MRFVGLMLILIEQGAALVPPKYLYPLGGKSFTYDVINNQDGIKPKSTHCFTVGPNHPQLSFSAMYFDRNVNKYADVRIPSDNSISSIGFTVFFNALDPSGYLFHYRSDNQGNIDFITEMYVKIDNGQVISKIDTSGDKAGPLQFPVGANGPHTISLNTWIMISFTNFAVNGTTYLFIDTLVEQVTHTFKFSLKTPGTLRFGASLPSPFNTFHGFMTCGAIYNVASGFDNVTEILQYCSEKNWPNSPPILIEQGAALVPPKYLYPLGGKSFTYDVINNQDGIKPKSTHCFTVGPNHPQLSFSAMYFDRNVNKYADVRIPSDNSISSIGFTVFFNALDPSGYLFHYRSDNQGNIDFITEMYVKIDNGQVISKIDTSGDKAGPLQFPVGANGPHTISLNTWIMISFTNFAVNGTTYLFIDTLVEQVTHTFKFSLKTPGTLRFGASLPSPFNTFHGFMTCGAIYNVASGFDNVTEILQYCSEKNWPNSPPKPTCQNWYVTVSVHHLFPLDDVAWTSDVHLMLHNNNNKCLRPGKTHPSFDHRGLRFDGSSYSSFKLTINSSDLTGDFSLMTYIYFQNYSSGKIIQILSSSGNTVLELIHTGTGVYFEAFTTSSSCALSNITTNINFNSWILLGILRETNQLLVSIDDNIFHIPDTCGSFGLSDNAYIEIGNSERGSIGFRGSMRCLVLFNELLDTNVGSTMNHFCTAAQSDAVTNVINNCDVQPLSERKYLLLRHNVKPVNTFQQLSSGNFRSLPACAAHCFTLAFCRSFTYTDGYCVYYDEITDAGLIPSPGSRFYIRA
ncbi:hypothetical protein LOTGIDRAFT_233580 [Lottia gigantea]|uniref:Apple domain-containing protein n=1 Tax=Lottia gigantea TaxID=225164 RepID=V4BP80_LOTGI|nr:hypothetical protein LOTGIDRAFT_233580 [Lottia gigantea]ESO90779.1 hypothetical protein LOTGIDRAFT_233580 [Lottia gigantea]